jgi:hypothetical protein
MTIPLAGDLVFCCDVFAERPFSACAFLSSAARAALARYVADDPRRPADKLSVLCSLLGFEP